MHAGVGVGGEPSENIRLFEVLDEGDGRRGWLRGTLKFEDNSLLFTDVESARPEPQVLVRVPHLLFCSEPIDMALLPHFPHGGFVAFQINSIGRCIDDNIFGSSANRQLIVLVESERDKSLWMRRINNAVTLTHFWTNCRVESTATRRTSRAVGDEKYWRRKGMLVSAVSLSRDGYLHVFEDLPGPRPSSSRSGASVLRKAPAIRSVRADAILQYRLCESPAAAKNIIEIAVLQEKESRSKNIEQSTRYFYIFVAQPPTVVRLPGRHSVETKVSAPEQDTQGDDEQGHENYRQHVRSVDGGGPATASAGEESNAFDFLDALDDLCEARRAAFTHLVRIGNVEAVLKILEATPKQPHLREQRHHFFVDAEVYNGDLSTNPIGVAALACQNAMLLRLIALDETRGGKLLAMQNIPQEQTLLHLAVSQRENLARCRVIEILVSAKIDVNIEDSQGYTALQLAYDMRRDTFVNTLEGQKLLMDVTEDLLSTTPSAAGAAVAPDEVDTLAEVEPVEEHSELDRRQSTALDNVRV